MQPLTFADRLDFAAGRAAHVFTRRSAIRLAYRAHQFRLRRWTVTAPAIGMGPEAMPRQLRWPSPAPLASTASSRAGLPRSPPRRSRTTASPPRLRPDPKDR